MVTVEEFSRTVQVASYEVGANEKIKLSVLLRMAQETSEQHLGELGIGYERLKADGIVFLMTNYRLLIKRLPVHNDAADYKDPSARHGGRAVLPRFRRLCGWGGDRPHHADVRIRQPGYA